MVHVIWELIDHVSLDLIVFLGEFSLVADLTKSQTNIGETGKPRI